MPTGSPTPKRWCAASTEQTGAGARVSSSTDRLTAVEGADYVINEIQVGGYRATRADFDIPARYGVHQTISDTIGIGGIFRGLRTIPVLIQIGEDLAKVAPDAYLLNYSNPMAMLPWAVYAGTPFQRVVGMCHSVRDTHRLLAELVDVPLAEIDFRTAGFNHQAFVLRFEREGQDLYPALRAAIDADPKLQRPAANWPMRVLCPWRRRPSWPRSSSTPTRPAGNARSTSTSATTA
jgi:alpha-galactosidase